MHQSLDNFLPKVTLKRHQLGLKTEPISGMEDRCTNPETCLSMAPEESTDNQYCHYVLENVAVAHVIIFC